MPGEETSWTDGLLLKASPRSLALSKDMLISCLLFILFFLLFSHALALLVSSLSSLIVPCAYAFLTYTNWLDPDCGPARPPAAHAPHCSRDPSLWHMTRCATTIAHTSGRCVDQLTTHSASAFDLVGTLRLRPTRCININQSPLWSAYPAINDGGLYTIVARSGSLVTNSFPISPCTSSFSVPISIRWPARRSVLHGGLSHVADQLCRARTVVARAT